MTVIKVVPKRNNIVLVPRSTVNIFFGHKKRDTHTNFASYIVVVSHLKPLTPSIKFDSFFDGSVRSFIFVVHFTVSHYFPDPFNVLQIIVLVLQVVTPKEDGPRYGISKNNETFRFCCKQCNVHEFFTQSKYFLP